MFVEMLNNHAPMKEKYVRANNPPFMNKILSKAVMTRSRLRNRYLKDPITIKKVEYKKYRNYCVRLFKKEKKKYYERLDIKRFADNKKFWKTVKPLFSDKQVHHRKITLIENDEIISNDANIVEIMNAFFSNVVEKFK